jgi:hypothetical protein
MLTIAAQLRATDVLGLVGFMLAGLAALAWEKSAGAALVAVYQPTRRLRERAPQLKNLYARFTVVMFGGFAAGAGALCLVGVIKLRPQPNPLPGLLGAIGALGLVAFLPLACRALVAIGRDSLSTLRDP